MSSDPFRYCLILWDNLINFLGALSSAFLYQTICGVGNPVALHFRYRVRGLRTGTSDGATVSLGGSMEEKV